METRPPGLFLVGPGLNVIYDEMLNPNRLLLPPRVVAADRRSNALGAKRTCIESGGYLLLTGN